MEDGGEPQIVVNCGELCLNRVAEGEHDAARVGMVKKEAWAMWAFTGERRRVGVGWGGGAVSGGQEAAKSGEWCP